VSTARRRAKVGLACALLVAIIVWLFHPVLPLTGTPSAKIKWDSVDFAWPYISFLGHCIRAQIAPLWNPFSFAGTQFWGNLQSLALNPLTLLAAASIDVTLSRLQVLEVAQIALGGFGMLLWARVRTSSWLLALVGAVAFVGGGTVVDFFSHYTQLSLYCLLPWPFALFRLWRDRRRVWFLVGTTLSLFAWLGTSYPSQLGYYLIAFWVFFVVTTVDEALRTQLDRRRLALELACVSVVPVLLAFVHLWPAVLSIPLIARHGGVPLATVQQHAVAPHQLFSILVGGLATAPSVSTVPDITMRDFFVGATIGFLVVVALSRPTRTRLALLAAMLLCIDLMLQRSLLMPLVHRISPLSANSRHPMVEFGSLLGFVAITLALDGALDLAQRRAMRARVVAAFLGVAAAVIGVISCADTYWPALRTDPSRLHPTVLPPVVVLGLLAIGVVLFYTGARRGPASLCALLFVAVVVDVFGNVRANQFIEYDAASPEMFRANAAHLAAAGPRYFDLASKMPRRPTWPVLDSSNLVDGAALYDGGYDSGVFRVNQEALSLPHARAVLLDRRLAFVADEVTDAADPASVPLLQGDRVVVAVMSPAGELRAPLAPARSSVSLTRAELNSMEYSVDGTSSTLVVFNQLLLPGWTLRIDGQPRPLWRANQYFPAAAVPPGRHQCTLRYRPPGWTAGLIGSGLGLIALVALLVGGTLRRRTARPPA